MVVMVWNLIGFCLTPWYKGREVLGAGVRVPAIKKFQIANHKYQTNHNDRNSKSQSTGF
jgi:hypothetical protein